VSRIPFIFPSPPHILPFTSGRAIPVCLNQLMATSSSSSSSHVFDDSLTGSSSSTHMRAPIQLDSDSHFSSHTWSHHSAPSALPASRDCDLNGKLIEPSSPRSRSSSRLPTLPPSTNQNLISLPESAISPNSNTIPYNFTRQDVRNTVISSSVPYSIPTSSRNVKDSSTPVDSPLSNYDDSLNSNSTRPRTSTQLFPLLPDLAAHYGIPQLLPPAPRTTPRNPSPPSSSTSNHPQPALPFEQVCSNYLNMLSQKPEDSPASESTSPVLDSAADYFEPGTDFQVAHELYELFSASPFSPDYTISPDYPMSEFLTSPADDSPLDDMLTTPHLGSDMLTSPLLTDTGDAADMDLFGGLSLFEPSIQKELAAPIMPTNFDLDNLYAMPSPVTPSLNPNSVYASPHIPTSLPFPPPQSTTRRKSSATGTRKNVTPESLVPLDAPTQPRKYATPSATSRKELPAVFAKKRARSHAFGEDDDDLLEEPLPPNATEKEQIEWKRRQNTLAARKSRKRKLQHQMELEETVERLTAEKETWRVRAMTYQSLLKQHGLDVPEYA